MNDFDELGAHLYVHGFGFVEHAEDDGAGGLTIVCPTHGFEFEPGTELILTGYFHLSADPEMCDETGVIEVSIADPDAVEVGGLKPRRIGFNRREYDAWGYLISKFRFKFKPTGEGVYMASLIFEGITLDQYRLTLKRKA